MGERGDHEYFAAGIATTVSAGDHGGGGARGVAALGSSRAKWAGKPQGEMALPAGMATVASVLKRAGYATACAGKWGMGWFGATGDPLKVGFDHFYGYNAQRDAHNYFPPGLYNDDRRFELDGKTYAQNLIQRDTLAWIRQHKDQPFFFFYAVTLPHGNYQIDDLGDYARTDWTPQQKAYAAMVSRLDRDVGELLALLQKLEIDDQTLVLLAGDNGSAFAPDSELARHFAQSQGSRGHKRSMYEGGLRQAAIARWPVRVPAGKVSNVPWAFWDFLPTAATLAGAKVPAECRPDGVSLVPMLEGGELPARDSFYWELHENRTFIQAVRFGDWKAVRSQPGAPLELYDLRTDPGERRDLAGTNPDVVAQAESLMKASRTADPNWPTTITGKPKNAKSPRKT